MNRQELERFRCTLTQWIYDLYHDTDTNGYLLKEPSSLCAKKTKQLVEYTLTKSSELSAIRLNRRKTQITTQNVMKRSLYFFIETIFPVCISVLIAYIFFMSSMVSSQTVPDDTSSSSYVYPAEYENLSFIDKSQHIMRASWHQVPTLDETSNGIGSLLGYTLSSITNIFSVTLQKGIGISLPQTIFTLYYSVFTVIIGYIIYRITLPMAGICSNYRAADERRVNLQILEEEFIIEFERMVERAIYMLLQPSIMKAFQQLLFMSAKTASYDSKQQSMRIINTFSHDYSVMYMALIQPLEQQIRKMEIVEILHMSQPSANFANTMFRLIREANEDLAIQLNLLNQSLIEIPHAVRDSLISPIQSTVDVLQPIITTIVQRNI